MADVKSAAQWIGKLLIEERKYLAKVGEKISELQDELEWMHCFLRDADASQLNNSMARKWVAQIREFAYEAEDTLEKFLVDSRGRGPDLLSKFRKFSRMILKVIALHKVGNDIDALTNKMSFLTKKLHTYGIEFKLGESSSSWLSKAKDGTYFTPKKEMIIGREVDVEDLLTYLVDEDVTKVVSICGTGGIGKTFLAKEIFNNTEIRKSYQAFAWASISKPCQISAVQQELLTSLTSKSREQIAQMSDSELKHELRKIQLRKKCFIVLDGFWKEGLWDKLKEAFPISCRKFKSKILLTTRQSKVAEHVHRDVHIHELKLLDPIRSEKLLDEKFSRVPVDVSGDGKEKIVGLKEKMLSQCGGLPLAIVLLGGLLASRRTKDDLDKLEKNFNSCMIDKDVDKDELKPGKVILDLSYYELPYQLKPCFLYLGYFPTNLEITTTKLSRLWEAEGLVSSGENEESDETLEDVAESSLAELVKRSLVQVASRDLTGRVKTCRLPEVIQELCMDKALKANWLSVVQIDEKTDEPSSSSTKSLKSSRSVSKRKSRRLAIYCTKKLERLPSDYKRASYVRSLLFFNTLDKDDVLIPLEEMALKSTFKRYKLLRVLDIENIGLSSLPKDVGYLFHLRYLSLRGSWVNRLPHSIKYLRCLQILDLRVLSFVRVRIPNVLCRLERLVHLYLPAKPFDLRHGAQKLDLKGLTNLETLSNFSNMCKADDVCQLTALRQFSSCDYLISHESIEALLGLPDPTLIYLDYVSLRIDGQCLSKYRSGLAKCKALHKLWVKGNIPYTSLIRDISFPYNLNKLCLIGSGLMDDPMPILEKLGHLKELSLDPGSYNGTRMICSEGGFMELKYLNVEGLEYLEEWIIESGAMPKLVLLEISRCYKLEMIPCGLSSVKSLNELIISYMPVSFYRGWTPMKRLEEWVEYEKIQHVSRVDISKILDIQQANASILSE